MGFFHAYTKTLKKRRKKKNTTVFARLVQDMLPVSLSGPYGVNLVVETFVVFF